MTNLRAAEDATAAQWLLRPGADWWDLVRYGPPGFDVYVRIAFSENDDGDDAVRAALVALASHTSTVGKCHVAVWEGWCGTPPIREAPRFEIPNREMLLFTGPVNALRDAPALAWDYQGIPVAPHLVWPEDRAWCLACEVDEEIEFTVGCSHLVAHALADAFPDRTQQVEYGDDRPLYRDQLE